MKVFAAIGTLLIMVTEIFGQTTLEITDTINTPEFNSIWRVRGGDTLVQMTWAPVMIYAYAPNRHKKKSYDRLAEKVIKVYPYAEVAGSVMKMYGKMCESTTDEKERERLLNMAEKELKAQFEKDLRNMTISEGIILIKLIDRETGNTSYQLVRDMKGKFSAFMWQSVARVFGHNLKDDYDPQGEDMWIENIVLQIEDGTIPVAHRKVDPFHMQNFSQVSK